MTTPRPQASRFAEKVAAMAALPNVVGREMDRFGGLLRCETCKQTRSMAPGDAGSFLAAGWPKCCGHTMTWWTQRQIDAGEMS